MRKLLDDLAVGLGRGRRLRDDRVGQDGGQHDGGHVLRDRHMVGLVHLRQDGGGAAPRHEDHLDRVGRGKARDAVMVDHLDDVRFLDAVDGLLRLVVVDEHDLLAGLDALDQLRRLHALLREHPCALRRQRAQAHGLVHREVLFGVAVTLALGDDVVHVRRGDGRADGIVVGILVSADQNRLAHRSLLHVKGSSKK